MLSSELKQQIQHAYSSLLESKGYRARYCQRRMIADIANTLGDIETDEEGGRTSAGHICVVEAGTGTGKTVAYALSALPLARALDKRLVIATATVALQEQITLKDLPDIAHHAGLDFSFSLAKGRRRYLCLARLDQALQAAGQFNRSLPLYDDEIPSEPDEAQRQLYDRMLTRLGRGEWDGDRDTWSGSLEEQAWMKVSTDHVQCTGRKCSHFQSCYFYKAREQIGGSDCIVTNQDLVLADLMMGGGAVLPAPEDTIYVFDEGHHLPDKAVSHLSQSLQLQSTSAWLEQLPETSRRLVAELGSVASFPESQAAFEAEIAAALTGMTSLADMIEPLRAESDVSGEDRRYRFALGQVDDAIRQLAASLATSLGVIAQQVTSLVTALEHRLDDADGDELERVEPWVPVVAAIAARLESAGALFGAYHRQDEPGVPPHARWMTFLREDDVTLNASPVDVSSELDELLWSRCFGAVVTSATLAVSGDFERFRYRTGIPEDSTFDALPSPFDFGGRARINIPAMPADPRDSDAHTEMLADLLPGIVAPATGALVLFSSWWQMNQVLEAIPREFRDQVLAQGTAAKAEILDTHRGRVDNGEPSVIFGLASFAEGIDLPGGYCDHVVIAKIPFAVPDDPVGATLSEWIESRGGNSFFDIMMPDAALRLVQACGRLMRTETDQGDITILDKRLITQRYGRVLLDALPPFRRNFAEGSVP